MHVGLNYVFRTAKSGRRSFNRFRTRYAKLLEEGRNNFLSLAPVLINFLAIEDGEVLKVSPDIPLLVDR